MAKSKDMQQKGKKRTQSDEKWKEGRGGSLRDVDPWGEDLGRGWEAAPGAVSYLFPPTLAGTRPAECPA